MAPYERGIAAIRSHDSRRACGLPATPRLSPMHHGVYPAACRQRGPVGDYDSVGKTETMTGASGKLRFWRQNDICRSARLRPTSRSQRWISSDFGRQTVSKSALTCCLPIAQPGRTSSRPKSTVIYPLIRLLVLCYGGLLFIIPSFSTSALAPWCTKGAKQAQTRSAA